MSDDNTEHHADELPTIKVRLQAAFDTVMTEANIPKTLQSLVSGFFVNFMANTDEAKLEGMLLSMRDELIPFILDGEDIELIPEVKAPVEKEEFVPEEGFVPDEWAEKDAIEQALADD